MDRVIVGVWVLGLSMAVASPADASPPAYPAGLQRVQVEVAHARRDGLRGSQTFVSPLSFSAYGLAPELRAELSWGVAVLRDAPDVGEAITTIGAANPELSLRHATWRSALRPGRLWAMGLDLRLGATAPAAWLGRDHLAGQRRTALGYAAGMRGLWNAWLWAPEQVAVVVGSALHWSHPLLKLRVEADIASTLSVGVATREIGRYLGQLALDARTGPRWAELGLRLQSTQSTADGNGGQLSVLPSIGTRVSAVGVRLGGTVNLDPPLGRFGRGLGVWALWLSLEVEP